MAEMLPGVPLSRVSITSLSAYTRLQLTLASLQSLQLSMVDADLSDNPHGSNRRSVHSCSANERPCPFSNAVRPRNCAQVRTLDTGNLSQTLKGNIETAKTAKRRPMQHTEMDDGQCRTH